jgi:hypothetical protein
MLARSAQRPCHLVSDHDRAVPSERLSVKPHLMPSSRVCPAATLRDSVDQGCHGDSERKHCPNQKTSTQTRAAKSAKGTLTAGNYIGDRTR